MRTGGSIKITVENINAALRKMSGQTEGQDFIQVTHKNRKQTSKHMLPKAPAGRHISDEL